VAVITGGAAGLGEATARLFVRNGARVVIVDIDDQAGERLVTELGDASARYVHCDVRKESDVAAAVTYAVSTFGKLDIYFSNAGIYRIDPIPLSRLSTFFVFSVSVSVSLDSVCVSLSHDESTSHVRHHSYMSIIFTRTAFTSAQLLDSSTKQNFRQKKVEQCDKKFTNDMEEGQKCPVHHHHHISIPVQVSEFCWLGTMIWLLKKPNA
jgi:hypothetical protein